jgi:dephospho-CoA kinase
MVILGLTGSIGTGKSTVAGFFKEFGAHVIDWDKLAREVVRPHLRAWQGIVDFFGEEVLNEDLTIDRQKLASMVFGDQEKVTKLNQIVHPEIHWEDARLTKEIGELHPDAIIVKDIPLLNKEGRGSRFDKIVTVAASEEIQLERLEKRGMEIEDAKRRIKSQLPLEEKIKFSDFVIDNNGSVEKTREQVKNLISDLKES